MTNYPFIIQGDQILNSVYTTTSSEDLLQGSRRLLLDVLGVMNEPEKLSFLEVSGINGPFPIFKPFVDNDRLSFGKSKKLKDYIKSLDRIYYIPTDLSSIKYLETNCFNKSIDQIIEKFGQVVGGHILIGDLTDWQNEFYIEFTTIRRLLQKEKKLSEFDAYIYIYKTIVQYIGISYFMKLQNDLGRYPNHIEHYKIGQNFIWNDLNHFFNELHGSDTKDNHELFFLIRDVVYSGGTSDFIQDSLYNYSNKYY